MLRAIAVLAFLFASVVLALSVLWPLMVIGIEMLSVGVWQNAGLDARRLLLLTRGWLMTLAASMVAQLFGAGLAIGLVSRNSLWRHLSLWVGLWILMTPPYIYAYAWSLPLLPEGLAVGPVLSGDWRAWMSTQGRAILCLSAWSAPLAGFVLSVGWRQVQPAWQLMLADASSWRVTLGLGFGLLRPWLLMSVGLTFLLVSAEYSVCHLCLVQTWNTELLAAALIAERVGQASGLAWPLIMTQFLVVGLLLSQRATLSQFLQAVGEMNRNPERAQATIEFKAAFIVWLITQVLLVLPMPILLGYLDQPRAFIEVWQVFPRDWPISILAACVAGLLAALMASAASYGLIVAQLAQSRGLRRLVRWALSLVVLGLTLMAILPPAVVGDAFSAAFVQRGGAGLRQLADHWVIISLLGSARFGVIAMFLLLLRVNSISHELLAQSQLETAEPLSIWQRVVLPSLWPLFLLGGGLVAILTVGEVAGTQMVRPPSVPNLAVTLLNQIHFGRQDQIIAMSVTLFAAIGVLVALGMLLSRRRN